MAERRLLHGGFELGVVDTVELEHEEQEMRGRSRDALLHVGVELRAGGIDRVARMHETGKRNEPSEKIVERLVALYSFHQPRTRRGFIGERRKLALVRLFEGNAFRIGAIEVALHLRVVHPAIEVGEIPFRQRPKTGGGRGLDRALRRASFCLRSENKFGGTDERHATTRLSHDDCIRRRVYHTTPASHYTCACWSPGVPHVSRRMRQRWRNLKSRKVPKQMVPSRTGRTNHADCAENRRARGRGARRFFKPLTDQARRAVPEK